MSSDNSYVLALDQGTTSSRAILFDHDGRIRGVAQEEFEQYFPRPGRVEHDPNEIWSSQIGVAQQVLEEQGVDASEVEAIGITNQRETTLLWDRETGEPVTRAIVWQDRRTSEYCDRLEERGALDTIRSKTGLLIDPYFSGTKLRWMLNHVDGARERAAAGELAFGTVDSWLVWNLTGGELHMTDVTNASRTLLYNIHSGEWDRDLLKLLDVPAEVLPEVRASSEVYAETKSDLLGSPVPIAGIAGDQQAALFGQVCTEPGMAKNTYGTGCFLLMNTGTEAVASEHELLTTIAWQQEGEPVEYALEGSIFVAGAAVQWLRDGLGIIDSAPEVEELARSVDGTDGVYLVPAFAGLGAPHWDPYARGTLVGMTRGTTDAHIARATLEGIAHQVADVVDAMAADSGIDLTELRVDGGAAANDLLMQMQSDFLGEEVVRPAVSETTALGAAYLAGLATGYWADREEIARQWTADARFGPEVDPFDVAKKRGEWDRAVERAKGWAGSEDA